MKMLTLLVFAGMAMGLALPSSATASEPLPLLPLPWPTVIWAPLPVLSAPATFSFGSAMQVSFEPLRPTTADEVFITVSGWKASPTNRIDRITIDTSGETILVDIYWISVPVQTTTTTGDKGGMVYGQSCTTIETVPTAHISAQPERYEVTRSLGTLSAGTHRVHVTNHGTVTGDSTTAFTVQASGPQISVDESLWPWLSIWTWPTVR